MMLIGALLTNVTVLQGDSSVMFTSYVPMQAAPNFYLGLILFAVGALIGGRHLLRHPGDRQGGAHLRGLGPAGHLRRHHRGGHRGVHDRLGRDHPGPDLAVVAGLHQLHRSADVQAGLVGHGPLLAADQRRCPRRHLVRDRRHHARRQAAVGEGQPDRLLPLHPVPAAGLRPSPAGRAGAVSPSGRCSTPATPCIWRCSAA